MIAALFVERSGPYWNLPNVDPWDIVRDARQYAGPYPVVAHPPCARWGQYATGGPTAHGKFKVGDDEGCFESAVASVRKWGGVLEHPEASKAWKRFGIVAPPFYGGWVPADSFGGWTCCVDQGLYGHRAQKTTWLYAVGCELPSLQWGRAKERVWIGSGFNKPGAYQEAKQKLARLDQGFHSKAERELARQSNTVVPCERLSRKERLTTPLPFRDVLIQIAESKDPRLFNRPTLF